ncbi:MAG: DNA-primase RepB domain-containing protein [Hyphomicrobiales bacterium]|jgi:hypothetical protein
MTTTYNNQFKYLFDDLEDDKATIRDQECFLAHLWNGYTMADYPSYGLFAFRHRKTMQFVEKSMQITGLEKAREILAKYNRWDWDQYFCPNMFCEPKRQKPFARNTRLAWCDIDEADPFDFKPSPSMVWETSQRRTQALWIFDEKLAPEKAEAHSRALTYRHHGDKNGWPINKLLRIPGSINHKKEYDEPFVRLIHYDEQPIKTRPEPFTIRGRSYSAKALALDFDHKAHKRLDVLKKYKAKLDPKARALIRHSKAYEPDRSAQVFHIIVGLHEVGATIDEIASVLWDSPYFIEKHGQDIGKLNDEIGRVVGKLEGGR